MKYRLFQQPARQVGYLNGIKLGIDFVFKITDCASHTVEHAYFDAGLMVVVTNLAKVLLFFCFNVIKL